MSLCVFCIVLLGVAAEEMQRQVTGRLCTALTGTACVPQDFVELAKWEDRGYHAMRSSTEKAQRQLHKMQRQAGDVLRQPAAAVLAEAAKSVRLSNLAAPEQLPGAAPKRGRTVHLPSAAEPSVSRACVNFVPSE